MNIFLNKFFIRIILLKLNPPQHNFIFPTTRKVKIKRYSVNLKCIENEIKKKKIKMQQRCRKFSFYIFLHQWFEIIINSYRFIYKKEGSASPRCHFFMGVLFSIYNLMCSTNPIMKCTITFIWERFSFLW